MTEQEAKLKITAGLSQIYGVKEGIRMTGTVVAGIMDDFNQMVRNKPCESVQEEYRLEDGRATVFISGRSSQNGSVSYESIQIAKPL